MTRTSSFIFDCTMRRNEAVQYGLFVVPHVLTGVGKGRAVNTVLTYIQSGWGSLYLLR